jgi:hypothetical protein
VTVTCTFTHRMLADYDVFVPPESLALCTPGEHAEHLGVPCTLQHADRHAAVTVSCLLSSQQLQHAEDEEQALQVRRLTP